MDDKKLNPIWGKLARALGVHEIPEPVKAELLREYEADINVAIGTGDSEALEDLVRVTKSLYRVHLSPRASARRRKTRRTPSEDIQTITPRVGEYESLRTAVLSEYLAKMASIDPRVVRFRNEVLDGEILTLKEARAFFSSPATRFLDRKAWQADGIAAKHSATLVDEDRGLTEDGPYHFVRVRIDPPGTERAVFWDIPSPLGYKHLTFLAEDGTSRVESFWPHSVLGDLRTLCEELVKAHPWGVDEAAWFVVTGEVPLVRPIKAKVNSSGVLGSSQSHTTISLTIQPWVSPETVEVAYRQVQRQVIGSDNRRISEKNLNLLRFVTERADAEGNLPEGRVLVQEWDKRWKQERPQWCYYTDTRRFWRDFRSAQKSVTSSRRAGLVLKASE